MVAFLIAVLPSAGVLFLFWVVLRALLQADRRERAAQARIEAEQDRDRRSEVASRSEPSPDDGAG